jgi:hypothetical protein
VSAALRRHQRRFGADGIAAAAFDAGRGAALGVGFGGDFGGAFACVRGALRGCAFGAGLRVDAGGPSAIRIPRAFIQRSKSSALIRRPFWIISKRLDLPTATGAEGAGSSADGGRLAQAESSSAAEATERDTETERMRIGCLASVDLESPRAAV